MRSGRVRCWIPLLVAAGLVVASCGDDTTDQVGAGDPSERSTTTTSDVESEPGRVFADLPHACALVEPAEVEALIGPADEDGIEGRALDGARYTQCFWDGHDGITMIGVSVVATRARYDLHASTLPDFEPLDGLGDEALAAPGVSSETRGATGGRTVSIRIGEVSVVVALRYEDVTPVDEVRPLAESVVSRLA
jgi:hypothetical protein